MNMIQANDYGTRKLAHYNAWLLDPNREFGKPYPGFPEAEPVAKTKRVKVAAVKTKAVAKKAVRTRARSGETKLDKARALFKANMKLSRENMIALFMEKLEMSKAGATTYYYNAQK